MGALDKKQKVYFENPKRFADAWNATVFQGEQVIKAEELQETNTVLTVADGANNEERIADVIMMRTRNGDMLGLLILENQDSADYSIPVRIFHEEALAYMKQVREIESRNQELLKKSKDYGRLGAYYYYFSKDDKIRPVTTLVLCWNSDGWDGARSLWDITNFDGVDEMRDFVPEYPLQIIDVAKFANEDLFQTDLGTLVGLYRRRNNKKEFQEFALKSKQEGKILEKAGQEVFGKLVSSRRLINEVCNGSKKEEFDMCTAIEEIYQDGVDEGFRKSIINLLSELGEIPTELTEKIDTISGGAMLQKVLILAAKSESLATFEDALDELLCSLA